MAEGKLRAWHRQLLLMLTLRIAMRLPADSANERMARKPSRPLRAWGASLVRQ